MEPITGRQFGPYTLTHPLAHGGMAEVYLACEKHSKQLYALKVVEQIDTECSLRFRREVQTLQKACHPHILPVLDYGEVDGFAYYVMPYIAHGTLQKRLRRGPLSVHEAEPILTQVGEALHYLHEAGLVHRDLKPANILLDGAGYAWLADFGLAREFNTEHHLTEPNTVFGTPFYMAPELVEYPASPRSDIYALGVVLYEMLTGHRPFTGTTALEICWKHRSRQPPLPSRFNPHLAPEVEEVIMRALAKKPEARFATVRELIEAYPRALASPAHTPSVSAHQILQLHLPRKLRLAAAMTLLMILGTGGLTLGFLSYPSVTASTSARLPLAQSYAIGMPTSPRLPGYAAGTKHAGAVILLSVPLHGGKTRRPYGEKSHGNQQSHGEKSHGKGKGRSKRK